MKLVIQYLKRLFANLSDRYWRLEKHRRHQVGWTLVICSVLLIGGTVYGVGYGIYSAGCWVKDTISCWFGGNPDSVDNDRNVASLDEYSGKNSHRKFQCGELNRKRRVNFNKDFKDLNEKQLIAARRLGIAPVADRETLDQKKGKLIKLKDTRYYHVDPMTHSAPYLVPDATDFLTALGKRWQEYHGTSSRFIITSCLRTEKDIKRLRTGNVNAIKESCHRYGTTFDITYVRFDRHGKVRDGKLKEDLARALYDMKVAGHCYVKYEYKQSCFHVTVRPK